MSIRLRIVNGRYLALCAARSVEKLGDIYLDDNWHSALAEKFSRDWDDLFQKGGVYTTQFEDGTVDLIEQEESNNSNRSWWDCTYGTDL